MIGRWWKMALPVLLTLALAMTAAADDRPGDAAGDRPGELPAVDGEAEAYEPRILSREERADGLTSTVIELPADADTYIASEWPQQNFGDRQTLFLGYNLVGEFPFGAQRTLLRFDVESNLPDEAFVKEAYLRLYLHHASPEDDEPMGTHLHEIISAWDEHTVTWETEPFVGEMRSENEVGVALGWYEWDVTELVRDWVADELDNHGMRVLGDERIQQRERAFYSREAPNLLYPRLVIEYFVEPPPIAMVDPLPEFVGRDFQVSWTGSTPGEPEIVTYDVEYRVDGGDWIDWLEGVDFEAATFAATEHGRFYEFRVRATDEAGHVGPFSEPEGTTVDIEPPSTTVDPLPAITRERSFTVSWTGEDELSGIHYYDVRYRFSGEEWIPWQTRTLTTTMTFTAMVDGLYDFEARAVDNVGNVESFEGRAEASIIVDVEPPFVEPRIWLPLVAREH